MFSFIQTCLMHKIFSEDIRERLSKILEMFMTEIGAVLSLLPARACSANVVH